MSRSDVGLLLPKNTSGLLPPWSIMSGSPSYLLGSNILTTSSKHMHVQTVGHYRATPLHAHIPGLNCLHVGKTKSCPKSKVFLVSNKRLRMISSMNTCVVILLGRDCSNLGHFGFQFRHMGEHCCHAFQ